MSEQTIYNALRDGGLSPAGACAMMGNMYCESGLKANNVQDNCPVGDADYTWNVDNGHLSKWQFMSDSFGYGLCQWTYYTRKEALYLFAKEKGVSISDEQMQCEFCLAELQADYKELLTYLCTTEDVAKATERICAEFERPAVNNFAARINAAQRFYNELYDEYDSLIPETGCTEDACPITFDPAPIPEGETCQISVRILKKGDMGRDVFLLQAGLTDMGIGCGIPDGDFGKLTDSAVKDLQRNCGLDPSGIADQAMWQIIFQ